jgi:large conductance mechanosensitive channel
MKKFANEFKTFIMRGNVMDLAVGVIIGGAFQAIVTAFINDMIMPFIGLLTGGINFNEQFLILRLPEGVDAATVTYANASELGVTIWGYGAFITAVINFLIMALVVFLLVKGINKISEVGKKKEEEKEEAPTTKKCPHCCEEVNINATKCPHCTGDIPAEE